ncbi:MAG: hypothetical protein ACWGPR_11830 [Candidatus Deferrimicrobiaceae bacterium]
MKSWRQLKRQALVRVGRAVPWDHSEPPKPGEPTRPNEPSELGAKVGRRLAMLADLAEAEDLERFPNQNPRCNDCAFRLGTLPNQCEETLGDAIKCVVEGQTFYCHKGQKDRPCMGWVVLQSKGVGKMLAGRASSFPASNEAEKQEGGADG